MSPFLRGTLFGLGLAGAFVAGYFLKNPPSAPKAAAEAPTVAEKPRTAHAPATAASYSQQSPPLLGFPDLPPVPTLPPAKDDAGKAPHIDFDNLPRTSIGKNDPIDPSDPTFQIIRRNMGLEPTVLRDVQPLPPAMGESPRPMTGPTPRLTPPPPPPSFGDGIHVRTPITQVCTRPIALKFEMTRLGTGKVTTVELWTTRDGGASWERTDEMYGCLSPFQTRLWSEGIYGFLLVFENEFGLKTPTPKPGDLPDLEVELIGPPLKSTSEPAVPEGKLTGVKSDDEGPEVGPMPRMVGSADSPALHHFGTQLLRWSTHEDQNAWDVSGDEYTLPTTLWAGFPREEMWSGNPVPMPYESGASVRSIMTIFGDSDWKPSTATPESYRIWQREPELQDPNEMAAAGFEDRP